MLAMVMTLGLYSLAGGLLLGVLCWCAPEGYQDESGFHPLHDRDGSTELPPAAPLPAM